jgi:predicted DNA-binding transcriptional regulator AlpA
MRILRYPDLQPEKGISYTRKHLRQLEVAGKFPRRIRFNEGGYFGWLESEIDDYIHARAAARSKEEAA